MVNITTPTSPKAFALDVLGLAPEQTIPQSVLITCTSKAGEVEGDEPAVRVPAVNLDDSTGFVPEEMTSMRLTRTCQNWSFSRAKSRCWCDSRVSNWHSLQHWT